jgi:hypothetical protein
MIDDHTLAAILFAAAMFLFGICVGMALAEWRMKRHREPRTIWIDAPASADEIYFRFHGWGTETTFTLKPGEPVKLIAGAGRAR